MDSNNRTLKTAQFTKLSSQSLQSITLYDWWLVMAEGKGLAVGGIASRVNQEVRGFCSAAIAKRHNTTTLETIDGITITVCNLINRSRTQGNGFPMEVCNHFLHGFPFYWEEYVDQCCGQVYMNRDAAPCGVSLESNADTLSLVSLDDVPATRLRDILISPRGHSSNDVLQRELLNVLVQCGCRSVQDETPRNQNKDITGRKHRAAVKRTPGSGVVTRSMAKLQNLENKQDKDSTGFLTQFESMATGSSSRGCNVVALYYNDKELRESSENSAVRRSSRLKNQAKSS